MPDRHPRLRRVAYLTAVMMCCAAFVLALTGIATTQGHVRPNGEAAAAVKRLQHQQQVSDHSGRCHRVQQTTVAPQREV
jgi:hypothetical protein